MKPKIVRQGDVLIMPVKAIPDSLNEVMPEDGRYILARGEATGHHHSIKFSERVAMFREDGSGGGLFLSVSGPVQVEHQEHAPLTLERGSYAVRIQRTFVAGMVQRVSD